MQIGLQRRLGLDGAFGDKACEAAGVEMDVVYRCSAAAHDQWRVLRAGVVTVKSGGNGIGPYSQTVVAPQRRKQAPHLHSVSLLHRLRRMSHAASYQYDVAAFRAVTE